MKVVHGAEMSYTSSGLKHRPGAPLFKFLLLGEENTPDNFLLMLARQERFYSPRHHHNFEQFRYAYKGDITLGEGEDWLLKEGEVAYFPEGAWYGPQNDGDAVKEVLVLQFGGPSGQGFLSFGQLKAIQDGMDAQGLGKFEGGKFVPASDPSKAIDGYEALWENKHSRKLEYPVARYKHPLLIDSQAFSWRKLDQEARGNVLVKPLGVFSDGCVSAQFLRAEKGGLRLPEKQAIQLLFVRSGTAMVNGMEVREQSAAQLMVGEGAEIAADDTAVEILHFTLPSRFD
ncbi:hypothetical protein A1O7_09102 [Cladophialophora yegresii CBS 114405]|uniref:Cupin type-2 domain-containing protein n=1 Tax=Cladophialophora yegresii CBS 114405 TaxID=1182544 RepID=W9VVE6_9EURO|nr:uncharacterized protein A1O7_09102 [Cladophialophora yegresii CBS 114405]EXJ56171.1 hypothetical protein A1O7_09102 [Cladophialophora yegresii CBS 114405]